MRVGRLTTIKVMFLRQIFSSGLPILLLIIIGERERERERDRKKNRFL
jgi:hypothetical protein